MASHSLAIPSGDDSNIGGKIVKIRGNPKGFSGIVRTALLCGSASVIFAASPASAQTSEDMVATDDASEEGIIVTASRPIAESEKAALEAQKNSDWLVSVLSADSAGRLPDQNIAQATGRLPGVAVERDQGQARYISLRGAPNYWTTLSFDGINVVSPEGRDARFDSIPSAIASQVVVSKAVTPDMPGETISGNVNIITRSPLDYRGFRISGKLGAGKVELGDREEYEGYLTLSNVFDTNVGEIGVLLSGSYYERNMITDNFEIDWEIPSRSSSIVPRNAADRDIRLEGTPVDLRPGFETRFWARETENKLYRLTRRNWSVSGRFDFRPDADNTISLRSLYTIFEDDEARDNYIFDFDDRQNDLVTTAAPCTTGPTATPVNTAYADACNNNPFLGTVYGIDINQRSTLRYFRQSVFTNTIEGKHRFGGSWALKWTGNYTISKDDRSVIGEARWESPSTRTLRPTVVYDFTDQNLARVQLFTTNQLSGPTRFQRGTPVTAIDNFTKPLVSLRSLDAVDPTKAYTFKAELARDIGLFGGEGTIRAGFQFDQRTKINRERDRVLNSAAQFAAIGISTNYLDFSLDQPFLGEIPLGYTFRYFDIDEMLAVSRRADELFGFNPVAQNQYNVRERVFAGYLVASSRFDWGSIVGGVRVEKVTNRGRAQGTLGATTTNLETESSSTLAFPSLHVNLDVTDEQKLRIGFTSGAARADYDQMRPNVVVDDVNGRISGGNPAVKPERAYGVDAYYEYYAQPQGYFMLGAFFKRVEEVLYTSRRSFGSDTLNFGGVDRSGYSFSGITNGGNGRIFGVEAAFQAQLEPYTEQLGLPDWMGGFGITANATWNDAEVTKPEVSLLLTRAAGTNPVTEPAEAFTFIVPARRVPLPGTSEVVYNIGGYYEKYGLSLRLQYQFRTTWADGFADTLVDAGDTYWASDDELDFSARYELVKGLEVYFDASNLLNNPGRRYSDPSNILNALGIPAQRNGNYTIEWEQFGRRFTGGVRFTF
jgi:TonB-dependent receptor